MSGYASGQPGEPDSDGPETGARNRPKPLLDRVRTAARSRSTVRPVPARWRVGSVSFGGFNSILESPAASKEKRMTREQIEATQKALATKVEGLSDVDPIEVCHLAMFEADWGDERVTVEIRDFGHRDPAHRYLCCAKTNDGPCCVGQWCRNAEMAIAITHWYKLDRNRHGLAARGAIRPVKQALLGAAHSSRGARHLRAPRLLWHGPRDALESCRARRGTHLGRSCQFMMTTARYSVGSRRP